MTGNNCGLAMEQILQGKFSYIKSKIIGLICKAFMKKAQNLHYLQQAKILEMALL
jgi:hypothetical protein